MELSTLGEGRLVFTDVARGNPFRVWLEYIANWPFTERSGRDLESLGRRAGIEVDVELTRDATGLAMLASVRRNIQ